MRILVCDDRQPNCSAISLKLQASVPSSEVRELCGVDGRDLKAELQTLFRRVDRYLPGRPAGGEHASDTQFDNADLVFLDNNLSFLDIEGARLTAESIAGYIRAFTRTKYIVSLNKNPSVDFDLRYLIGDATTRADLALNLDHLAPGPLWGSPPVAGGFHPWYWPRLDRAAMRREEQISFVAKHLQDRVLESLMFPDDVVHLLSRHALSVLSPRNESGDAEDDGIRPQALTFMDIFSASTRSIPDQADRDQLAQRLNAGTVERNVVSSIVASDLDLWFRGDVVGSQAVLVDVPHLVARMPFLMGAKADDVDAYNQALSVMEPPFGMDAELYARHVAPTRYGLDLWVERPCFWWHALKADRDLAAQYSSRRDWADVVFCEDTSRFVTRSPDVREFVTEIESAWDRRYVERLSNVKYAPRSRFAM